MAAPLDHLRVLFPLVIALAMTFFTIIIHALALVAIVHFVRRERRLGRAGVGFWRNLAIVSAAALLALAAHLVEITAWAVLLVLCGEFQHIAAAFYHSAMNYTTLGYGDVVMSVSWRLLGPLEAADGMLMFGISTGLIVAVIQRLIQTRFAESAD